MNRQKFTSLLERRLFQPPQVEKEYLLNYYNETIENRMEDGMNEAEAVASLDSTDVIVKQVYVEHELSIEEGKPAARGNRRCGWKIVASVLLFPLRTILLSMAFVIYLLLWALLAVLFCIVLTFVCFLVGALWNLIPVVRVNAAATVVLLGCMFLFSGLSPLCWKLLCMGTTRLRNQTGIWLAAIRHLFVKTMSQMRVTLKQLLEYVSVICIPLGLLLIGGSFTMADFKMENLQTVKHKPYMEKEKTITMHQIPSIWIGSYRSGINTLPTRDDNIHIQYEKNDEYPMNITKDIASLQPRHATKSFQSNSFDLDHGPNTPITIELPKTFYGELGIDTSYGNVTVHDMAYQNITINNDRGNVSPSELKVEAVTLDVAYNSVVLNDVNSRRAFQLDSEHGDIISRNLKADSAVLTTAYSDITLDDTEITKDMTFYHEYAPVNLGKLKVQTLQIESAYGDIRSTGLVVAENADFSLERSGVTLQKLSAKGMMMENAYGDTMISEPDVGNILIEGKRGSFGAMVKGSIDDSSTFSEAGYGDNMPPAKYESSSRRKLQINVEYGNINVKFQK